MRNPPFALARAAAGFAAGLAVLATSALAVAQEPTRVPLDTETVIGGVGVGCTGIGQTKDQPRWLAYPVRVEFADAQRAYLAGEVVTASGPAGGPMLTVSCEGPWLLLKLPDARGYKVDAHLTEEQAAPRSTTVKFLATVRPGS